MVNTSYPLMNYNFLLQVEGMYEIPCKRVYSFQKEAEYEYIQEGGVNDYVHMKRKPAQKPNFFKVERYVGEENLNLLYPGASFALPVLLFVSRYPGEFEKPKRTYSFTDCVVTNVEYGELSAEKGDVYTEIVTISYCEMVCIDNPIDTLKQSWRFDGEKPEGKGIRYARQLEDFGVKNGNTNKARQWPKTKSHRDIKKYLG